MLSASCTGKVPPRSILPLCGRERPVSRRNNVDLPMPLAPLMRVSPQAGKVAVAFLRMDRSSWDKVMWFKVMAPGRRSTASLCGSVNH